MRFRYLEGLRGIAAFVVLLGHLRLAFSVHMSNILLADLDSRIENPILVKIIHSFYNAFFDGNTAVYIFWFMSAYVLSIKLHRDQNDAYLFRSLTKRYFRLLFPALGSILIAYILLSQGLMFNLELAQNLGPIYEDGWLGSHYNFEPNFVQALKSGVWDTFFAYDDFKTYNTVLWTMQPELYGSLFIFSLFGVFRQRNSRHLLYALISIITFSLGSYWLVSFIFGFWLCDIDYNSQHAKKLLDKAFSSNLVNFIFLLALFVYVGMPNYMGFSDMLSSTLIVILIMRTAVLHPLLESRLLTWLGKISFGLYLVHLPIICSISSYLFLKLEGGYSYKFVIVSIITLVTSFIIGHFFTLLIDKNGIRLSNQIGEWFEKGIPVGLRK